MPTASAARLIPRSPGVPLMAKADRETSGTPGGLRTLG